MILVVHDLPNSEALKEVISLLQYDGEVRTIQKSEQPFGEALRAARTARGKTLAQVSLDTGLSVTYLSDVERGNRGVTPTNAAKLSEVLGNPGLSDVFVGEKIWDLARNS